MHNKFCRRKYIKDAKKWGANPIVYYFDVDSEILFKRLSRRNMNLTKDTLIITNQMLTRFTKEFEPPAEEECKIVVIIK